jgi:AraC family transcriptional regulator of adaptative response/methylated-DNA-[protein]-cysteine methyltransferase
VTDAIHKSGIGSRNRLESANGVREATPAQPRDGDTDAEIFFALGKCSLGSILVARSDKGICSIQFGDDPILLVRDLQDQFPTADLIGDEPAYEEMVNQVIRIVENPQLELDLALDVRGTEFQQLVWKAVQRIPVGSTATYSDIAQEIGMPNAARAVAEACAANVLAVAIPCHRVIRADGSLSGYRWGVERKRALLEGEVQA